MRFFLLVALALSAWAIGETAKVSAAAEFCPATASVPLPAGAAFGTPARTFYYELSALTPRTVTGTLIADTTSGWYTWNVNGITLTNRTHSLRPATIPRQFFMMPYVLAESPTLAVTFPLALTVRHMWVTSAGGTQCDVPAFEAPTDRTPPTTEEVAATPSALYPMGTATPAQPPFASTGCDRPFQSSTVLEAKPPIATRLQETAVGPLAVEVEIALDPTGKLIDAWIYASSGYAGWNLAALRAARLSTYSGSISYCRPVRGTYLFVATVLPGG